MIDRNKRNRAGAARRSILTAVLLAAMVCVPVAPGAAVKAADADSETYSAQVKYYDDIQIKYRVQHGVDDWWTTTGDIPIGGFIDGSGNKIIEQAYCVDATVLFHSSPEVTTAWPAGVTTDTTNPGYVVVSPLAVSENVRANLTSLYWLAVNGFRGVRGGANDLADIRARYAALETQYGTQIDETIAIMATKVAVWNFTDPTFTLISTSLTKDPEHPTPAEAARYNLMLALMNNMVSDARANGQKLAVTTLDVEFSTSAAAFSKDDANNWYYGPVSASAISSNGTGVPGNIYLTAEGMYAPDFQFVVGNTSTSALLGESPMYGTATPAAFVANNGQFYVKIPAAVAHDALVNINESNMEDVNFQYLSINGVARSDDVDYKDTPAIMAWQGDPSTSNGAQDWGHVQAFIGYISDMKASLYGEGHLFLKGNEDNVNLKVSKALLGASATSAAGSFTFNLEVRDNEQKEWLPVPLIPGKSPDGNITGDSGLNGVSPKGLFSLTGDGVVDIHGLPAGQYRISEQESKDSYSAVFQVDTGASQTGFTAQTQRLEAGGSSNIVFTNTIAAHEAAKGSISVKKSVSGAAISAGRFDFTLERYDDKKDVWNPVLLTPGEGGNITGDSGHDRTSTHGDFSLAANSEAHITGLLLGRYRITEKADDSAYTTVYRVDAGAEQNGAAAEAVLSAEGDDRKVVFTNTEISHVATKGALSVSKSVRGDSGGDRFLFTLEVYDEAKQIWTPVALDPGAGGNISGNAGINAPGQDGRFSLAAKDTVKITGLPAGQYRVTEEEGDDLYTTSYKVDSDADKDGVAAVVRFTDEGGDHVVAFKNTMTENDEDSAVKASDKDKNSPDTGDSEGQRLPFLWLLLVAAGIGVFVCGRALRTKARASRVHQ